MPTQKILVTVYQCAKCKYRWTNWRNGREGPKPKRCAKCKKSDWDEGLLSPVERQLRRQLLRIEEDKTTYANIHDDDTITPIQTDICTRFLTVYPRPTEKELSNVLSKRDKDERHDLMGKIIDSRKGIMNKASTHHQYFDKKRRHAKY